MFLPHIRLTKHAEQDEIDAEWLGKKLWFWRESWHVGKNVIIANKSRKETEKLSFSVKDWFFHSWTPQSVFSLVATARENTACGVHSVK